jgi:hypothetical protein
MQWEKKKENKTSNDLQNITQKTKDWAPRTSLKPRSKLWYGKQFLLH